MSRFVNLELGGEAEELHHSEQSPTLKDEAYYLAEAQAAFQSGRFEPALRAYSKVLEFNPENAIAWGAQVRMLIELGEFREARVWADKALDRFPDHAELLAAKAVALGRIGDLDAAMAFSDAAMEQQGDTPYVWLARADVLLARKESRADYCIEKALLLAPRDWFIAWLAARIRFYYRQFILALNLFRQAAEWNPGNFTLWLDLGSCQRSLGMVGAAETSFGHALALNPQCSAADQGLAALSETNSFSRLVGQIKQWFHR